MKDSTPLLRLNLLMALAASTSLHVADNFLPARLSEVKRRGRSRDGLCHGERVFKVPRGEDGPQYLRMSAFFDLVVEDDLQRTVDERRLLQRVQ